MIVMTYFHPWTLRRASERVDEGAVKYAGNLRPVGTTWQDSLTEWLDGGIQCAESKRYIGNFLSVYRVRPQDESDDEGHSSDMADDEELEVSHIDLQEALLTKIGGRSRKDGEDKEEGKASHHENSVSGVNVAQGIWRVGADGKQEPTFVHPKAVDQVLQAAKTSQKRAKSLHGAMQDATSRDAGVRELTSATSEEVQTWLENIKEERNDEGRLLLNVEQYAMVQLVARRVMSELDADGDEEIEPGEPLRWLMHGGPGAGKSHVINILKVGLLSKF